MIAIIIANYNNEQYLQECIESVLAQTSDQWHIYFADDASSDDSMKVMLQYKTHQQITITRNSEHLGQGHTKDNLVHLSEQDIVAELDSDDAITPTCVEEIIAEYEQVEDENVFCHTNFTYCNKRLEPTKKGYGKPFTPDKFQKPEKKYKHFLGSICPMRTFRKTTYQMVDGYNYTLPCCLDKHLVCQLLRVAQPRFIDSELYLHRVLSTSVSHRESNKEEKVRIIQQIEETFGELDL